MVSLRTRPITLRQANAFVVKHHRHNDPAQGQKFSIGLVPEDAPAVANLRGVAIVSRPEGRGFDSGKSGLWAEITRTATDGTRNANSMLYGACARACKAMGYDLVLTYTQADESGASLRAAGFVRVKELPPRGTWEHHTGNAELKAMRKPRATLFPEFDKRDTGGVVRVLWWLVLRK